MSGAPVFSNMVLMRALGARYRTLAKRFGITEGEVRALFATWGEPAKLQPRRWCMRYDTAPSEIEVAAPARRSPPLFAKR